MEIPKIIYQSGWIAFPFLVISITNLALFIQSWIIISSTRKILESSHWSSFKIFQIKNEKSSAKQESLNPNYKQEISSESSIKNQILDSWEIYSTPILRNVSWITSLASSATLLGLLGTVLGIQESFTAMQELGRTTLDIFAGGVSRALSTTILGLCIAIPSFLLSQLLKSSLIQLTNIMYQRLFIWENVNFNQTSLDAELTR